MVSLVPSLAASCNVLSDRAETTTGFETEFCICIQPEYLDYQINKTVYNSSTADELKEMGWQWDEVLFRLHPKTAARRGRTLLPRLGLASEGGSVSYQLQYQALKIRTNSHNIAVDGNASPQRRRQVAIGCSLFACLPASASALLRSELGFGVASRDLDGP